VSGTKFANPDRLRLTYCLTAFLVFLGGLAIYVFFRSLNIVLFQIFPKPLFLNMLHFSVRTDPILMSLLVFNLPDGLWFLSGLLVIRAVWLTNPKWRAIYFAIFAFIALSMEISQIFENVPGTFDPLDVLFMGITAFIEGVVYNTFLTRRFV